MKGILIHVPFLWVEGIALFPFILIKHSQNGASFLNHERIHLQQQLEMGILPFYIWYLTEYLIRLIKLQNHDQAYRAISFEREAYAMQENSGFLYQRQLWNFLTYL